MKHAEQPLQNIHAHLATLDNEAEIESYLQQCFEEAGQAGDADTQAAVAELIIGGETAERLSAGLRMGCLLFLINHYFDLRTQYAEDSEEADALAHKFFDYLWQFKWVIPDLPLDADLAYELIAESRKIMQHYYDGCGLSAAPVHKSAMLQHMLMGEHQQARECFAAWQAAEADGMGDCDACEATEKVNYYNFIGEHEQALATAEPILSGHLYCAEVPAISYAPVLFSLIQLQRFEQARQLLPQAIAAIEANRQTIAEISKMIEAAVRLGEFDLAGTLVETHRADIMAKSDVFAAMRFAIATALISEEMYQMALELTGQFDARNRNHYYRNYLHELTGRTAGQTPVRH
ncbi:MAG: hypothetical protein Q4G28_07045 [Neisseria sp.]|nr:hypothetical protein [Neisseria sp.]